MASRSIEVELKLLTKANLLISTRDRSRIYYAANPDHPAYGGLKTLIANVAGLEGLLQEALALSCVEFAFLTSAGPQMTTQDLADLPLVLVVQPGTRDINYAITAASAAIHRQIDAAVFTLDEIRQGLDRHDPRVSAAIASPKTFIIGREDRFMERVFPEPTVRPSIEEKLLT